VFHLEAYTRLALDGFVRYVLAPDFHARLVVVGVVAEVVAVYEHGGELSGWGGGFTLHDVKRTRVFTNPVVIWVGDGKETAEAEGLVGRICERVVEGRDGVVAEGFAAGVEPVPGEVCVLGDFNLHLEASYAVREEFQGVCNFVKIGVIRVGVDDYVLGQLNDDLLHHVNFILGT